MLKKNEIVLKQELGGTVMHYPNSATLIVDSGKEEIKLEAK